MPEEREISKDKLNVKPYLDQELFFEEEIKEKEKIAQLKVNRSEYIRGVIDDGIKARKRRAKRSQTV